MEENRTIHYGGKIISTLLICLTIIWTTFYFVTNIKKLVPMNQSTGTMLTHTIQVNGEGKAFGKPDIVKLQISVSEIASTSKEAQKLMNEKTAKVLETLKNNKVDLKDIQTSELSLFTEYDWNSNTRIVRGQRATQRFTVTIRDINKDIERSGKIIDDITLINGIEISSMQFDIDDKTELFKSARELAYKKANQKAVDLAKLSGLKLSKPLIIKDFVTEPMYSPIQNSFIAKDQASTVSSSIVPSGELEIVVQLDITFGIEP